MRSKTQRVLLIHLRMLAQTYKQINNEHDFLCAQLLQFTHQFSNILGNFPLLLLRYYAFPLVLFRLFALLCGQSGQLFLVTGGIKVENSLTTEASALLYAHLVPDNFAVRTASVVLNRSF